MIWLCRVYLSAGIFFSRNLIVNEADYSKLSFILNSVIYTVLLVVPPVFSASIFILNLMADIRC